MWNIKISHIYMYVYTYIIRCMYHTHFIIINYTHIDIYHTKEPMDTNGQLIDLRIYVAVT